MKNVMLHYPTLLGEHNVRTFVKEETGRAGKGVGLQGKVKERRARQRPLSSVAPR